ncbi:CRP/FNR family transcriptional regulator, transcriptional activator FtrB [Roseovarius azorensis]|uniref:CRP/FNR family transcriptional regulator, transcriptional activator FtrB n=1 Tax=Roseovarius azorensis TaxID=1287727 RepID=A0A1H7JLB8_9RHOB|nr:cyclic nucleotide-binding domain-containing protein [Roseovarius azorensis]SEK75423.1 CRP/FNR family transcriptional regulator, transcriptional activator FtrB [Roseovarius azorensis]
MPDSLHPEIRRLHLFSDMAEDRFAALMRGAYVQNFPPQIELITEGDSSDFLHVLISGAVDLFARWNGRESSLATVRPVSTFILAATIRDQPYLMSARTMEKSRIVLIPSQDVRSAFEEDVQFARAIVAELAQRYRSTIKMQKDLKLRSSLERLANYLLRHQARNGGDAAFELETDKRRLASYLGMTPENLSRAFRGLGPYGVAVEGNRITITDQTDLEGFAKPDPLIDGDLT